MRHHVFLLPGFFGFDYLGDLAYFAHVRDSLDDFARREGLDVRLRVVATPPTASLRHRAARAVEDIHAAIAHDDGHVHLIGHSSGGLDARLVVTPEVSLPTPIDPEPLARRVRTVVTLSAPHHGTPAAAFFASLLGQQLLKVLSLATSYALRTGRLPTDVMAALVGHFVRAVARVGGRTDALDRLYERLLGDFSETRRGSLESFVGLIGRDQDLLAQLTPAAMDLFNASTDDRPTVRYACVVTQARGPNVRGFLGAGLSPYAHASHALYVALSTLAGHMPADRVPTPTPAQAEILRRDFPAPIDRRATDGIVPTVSQIWGEVLRGVWADHLDVIGHFPHPTRVPPHFDWLRSGSGFGRAEYVALWDTVARYVFA